MATAQELSDFLKSTEKRAYKRALYHVRDVDGALDIVQDSMMKLAEHYGDKPADELILLFQRILSNCILDWFRRQKAQNALFVNMGDLSGDSDDESFDLLEVLTADSEREDTESAELSFGRKQILAEIEKALQHLPERQREAFLMRYWEGLDVNETATAMGCTEGSVKTHCSRAIAKLSLALKAKGIQL